MHFSKLVVKSIKMKRAGLTDIDTPSPYPAAEIERRPDDVMESSRAAAAGGFEI